MTSFIARRPKTSKTASVLNYIKTKKAKKRTLFNKTRQFNIQTFNKNIYASSTSIGQDNSKLQKQISKLLILIATAILIQFIGQNVGSIYESGVQSADVCVI